MSSVRYTPQQKADAAYQVIVNGCSITRVAGEVGTTRKTLGRWVKSANVRRLVDQMRADRVAGQAPAHPGGDVEPAEGADLLDEMTRQRLRGAILQPMPVSQALALCRLSTDALDRWGEMADRGDRGAEELLIDLRQWGAEAISNLTRVVLEGASAGKGAQWLLSRLWRDLYGESIEEAPARNAIEAYSDADLAAIAAQEA